LISSREGETGGGDTAMPIPRSSFGKTYLGDVDRGKSHGADTSSFWKSKTGEADIALFFSCFGKEKKDEGVGVEKRSGRRRVLHPLPAALSYRSRNPRLCRIVREFI
jgi:hypothetical protein